MKELISKEELEELRKIKGQVRGNSLKGDAAFVAKEVGEERVEELERMMAEVGFPIKYSEIKPMGFYPLSLDAVNLVLIKRLFSFQDEKIEELGKYLAKISLILRLFMRYFVSIKVMAREASKVWKENYTIGELKVISLDEKNRSIVLRVEDFSPHPYYCLIFKGYFCAVVKMVVAQSPMIEEVKCTFRGDNYHEFHVKW